MARFLLLSFCTTLVLLDSTVAFNFDLRAPVKFDGPQGSLFGFSVAQHRDQNTDWVLIGAPEAPTTQPGVTNGGAVYKCPVTPLSGSGPCEQVPFDTTGNTEVLDKSNQWFGATLASSGPDGRILACAPRLVWLQTSTISPTDKEREPTGTCFVGHSDFTNFVNYSPCQSTDRDLFGFDKITHCQAGFSAQIPSDNSTLVMGAPGSYYLQGQIFAQSLSTLSDVSNTPEQAVAFDNSYRGYSLALGDFNGDGLEDYVVGTPRGESLRGLVAIFDQSLVEIITPVVGEQIVSYFGYSVASVDVNGDGLDDLLVGAPMFTNREPATEKWEAGRVYVYLQNADHSLGAPQMLTGKKIRARFGFPITSIGDSNQDGFNDVAIGAPYDGEDNSGVVYIYHGSAEGLRLTESQVLTPSELGFSDITTFGFSVDGGQDMDQNDYPDLVVGAESADAAILVRTRPVVLLEAELTIEPIGINLDNKTYELPDGTMVTSFVAMACFTYTGNHLPARIGISYTLTVDSSITSGRRALLEVNELSQVTKNRNLDVGMKFCDPLRAYVVNTIQDKLTPIAVDLQYELTDESILLPYEILPIINKEAVSSQTKQVSIQNNCVNNICIPEIGITVTPNLPNIVIGQAQELTLVVSINNRGEDAFQSTLAVYYPEGLQYVRLERRANMDFSVTCTEDSALRMITCDTGNPLVGKYNLEFGLTLSTLQVSGDKDNIEFYLVAGSENNEDPNTLDNNELNVTVAVIVDATLKLLSASYPEIVTYRVPEDNIVPEFPTKNASEADIGMEVVHLYEVRNTGSSNAAEVTLNIRWPEKDENGDYLFYLLGIMTDEGVTCQISQGQANPLGVKLEASTKEQLSNSTTQVSGRRKREGEYAEALAQAEPIFCTPESCVLINCTIDEIKATKSKVVRILGRFWERTFQKAVSEAVPVIQVTLASTATATVRSIPYNIPLPMEFTDSTKASTLITAEELVLPPVSIAWWIIVVSVLGGIILLLIIILGLWKCGFFERKKPGEDQKEYEPVAVTEKDGPPEVYDAPDRSSANSNTFLVCSY
ncbi:alphaP integrin precursor [Strongylocentrotus purpuratus]|uniref:AlphaP integrin n=1 Tax=Strongylocentrotus purpuratus TaxID=7668 RepID=Q9U6S1_STRPU|nr:alphaP integrin precursor [Strongylocentrotus purpuratus]AAD55724.1 alphaP integrin precursor [Strongylocentrotus purpuratus]|eukprot:NP_999642.1 alphaP integrin precursor [Strongylocentrotus purpuratus]